MCRSAPLRGRTERLVTVLSVGMALVRHWFPVMPPRASARGSLALEVRGTVTIARAADDRIEASMAARILVARSNGAEREPVPAELRVEDRRVSDGALAEARPFLWLQLVDDRGVALSHETFIGRGVGIDHNVHARIHLATLVDAAGDPGPGSHGAPARTRLSSGLSAKIVARTYRNPSGPRYHVETLILSLLAVGSGVPAGSESPSCCRDCHNELPRTVSGTGGYSPGYPLDARDGARPDPTPQASHESPGQPTPVACGRNPDDRAQRRFCRPEPDPHRIELRAFSGRRRESAPARLSRPGNAVQRPARMREQSGHLKRQAGHEPSGCHDAPS